MEALRYWRTNASTSDGPTNANTTTTIVTGVNSQTSETEEDDDNDHGPFFDLEFTLPPEDDKNVETQNGAVYVGDEDIEDDEEDSGGSEMNFTLMSSSSGDSTADVNVSVSPSDELFFNGGFVPVDQTTDISSNSKPPPQLRLALMKSATKFRVMMLKFRKTKLLNAESNASSCSGSKKEEAPASVTGESTSSGGSGDTGKSMTVRFNVDEVPIISLFRRHNSSKPSKKQQTDNNQTEDKRFTKETMQKYLRKVKPLYVRVSQKYGEKLKLAGNLTFTKPNLSPEEEKNTSFVNPRREKEPVSEGLEPPLLPVTSKGLKQGNLPAGLRVVCKHLGKTLSASPALATAIVAAPGAIPSKRRDDSLIQQEDGIQSAILHCKRSFKSSRDCGGETVVAGKCENSSISDAVEEVKK
ncbi:putative membrane-associated kinase regulator 2 [Bidens hawaiensis]|uniref:putative membrane-associated kinase regulator 2 n=1 Tax=Bidens hawaiensis TaxID=980011 RepID=UPI00404AD7AC